MGKNIGNLRPNILNKSSYNDVKRKKIRYIITMLAIISVLLFLDIILYNYVVRNTKLNEEYADREVLKEVVDSENNSEKEEEKINAEENKKDLEEDRKAEKINKDEIAFIKEQAQYFMRVQELEVLDKDFKKTYDKDFSDCYLYPSDRKKVSREILDSLNKNEILLLRNEIFARHGYKFKTREIAEYFKLKSWYKVNLKFKASMLTRIEKENVKIIDSYEREMKLK